MSETDEETEQTDTTTEMRYGEVVPTNQSDSGKRPSISFTTEEFDAHVMGAEGQTIEDVEPIFDKHFGALVSEADSDDSERSAFQ